MHLYAQNVKYANINFRICIYSNMKQISIKIIFTEKKKKCKCIKFTAQFINELSILLYF